MTYPYEHFKSIEDYEKPIEKVQQLGKDAYYSNLNNDYPDHLEIERTNHIINVFKIQNGRQLTQKHNEADVILLAAFFANFINTSQKELKINPLYNISLPGYTWDVGLKYTNNNLEKIEDVNMFQMFESGLRGGISGVLGDRYLEPNDESKIIYGHQTNLYGWAMQQCLPYDDFKEVDNNSIEDILNTG